MSLNIIGNDQIKRLNECKTEADYKDFVKEIGIEISDDEIDSVCGGLESLGLEEARSTLSDRLNRFIVGSRNSIKGPNFSQEKNGGIWL